MFPHGVLRRFRRTQELSVASSIVQAAQALEEAKKIARKKGDSVAMGNLSEKWLTLGATINELMSQQEQKKNPTGFSGGSKE